jgi:hypothetical protein
MKNIKLLLVAAIGLATLNSCKDTIDDFEAPAYVTFQSDAVVVSLPDGAQESKEITVYTANKTSSDRTIDIIVTEETDADPASYNVPTSITIPANSNEAKFSIDFTSVNLELTTEKKLVLKLQTDGLNVGEDLVIPMSQSCPSGESKVKITLGFDNWPEEAAWRLLDSTGATVLASADPFGYGAYDGFSGSLDIVQCITSGTYTFQVFDGYGDGGTSYEITSDGAQVVNLADDAYGASYSAQITL